MKRFFKKIFVVLLACGFAACGGGEEVDVTECGEGTEPNEDGLCEPAVECEDGEVHDAELGLCVRAGDAYCAEGTKFDETFGRCVADPAVQCGDDTTEDDGECVPTIQKSCGPGAVALNEECVPADDVCGDDTEMPSGEEVCRPMEDICGEGTIFDVELRLCVPESVLECGPGTTVTQEMICLPSVDYYGDLAADPDLNMIGESGPGQISLAEPGERFVFVGNIDEPILEDGEFRQQEDIYHVDAEPGQWLRIALFSLGLPEPGFVFGEEVDAGEDHFLWHSDLAAGIEVTRQILIPVDGSYELRISNLPQMLDEELPAAGGDDWGYVGFVETMEPPQPTSVDVPGAVSGELGDLSSNFYVFDEMGDVDYLGLLFDYLPAHAEAEVQIWSDDTTLEQSRPLGDDVLSFEVPGDSFYLLFDHSYAFGDVRSYSASVQQGSSLDPGQRISRDVVVEPGDYVGLFQDNIDGEVLSATIYADGQVVAETDELGPMTDDAGQTGLYWYAPTDWDGSEIPVQLEVQNPTLATLDFASIDYAEGSADVLTGIDGDLMQFQYLEALDSGHRHYVRLGLETDELLRFELSSASPDGRLTLYDKQGERLVDGRNLLVFQNDEQADSLVLAVEALEEMPDGFSLSIEETDIVEISQTSDPEVTIPENSTSGVDDVLEISGCNSVAAIDMDVVIHHTWRGDLVVRLTNPEGENRVLKSRPGSGFFGDSSDDIIGNFNATLDPVAGDPAVESAEPISAFEGSLGNGEWTINVSDNASGNSGGQLVSWTLNLVCDG